MDKPITYTLTREQLIELGVSEAAIDSLPISNESLAIVSPRAENRSAIEVNSNGFKLNDLPRKEPEESEEPEEPEEPEEFETTIDDLPELPFEKILDYLSLEDRIRARAVSRRWYKMIDSFKVKILSFSQLPSGFVFRKSRLITGVFAQNFIFSTKFQSFFDTFGQSILSSLKHLHLYYFELNEGNRLLFVQIVNSLEKLEKLGLFVFNLNKSTSEFELNLPTLKSIHIKYVTRPWKLTLNAPKLLDVEFSFNHDDLVVSLVHSESVERLILPDLKKFEVKKLKNLKYLCLGDSSSIDSTLLQSLKQLKEIHLPTLFHHNRILEILNLKQRCGRDDLKIFVLGLLLNGPDDPAISVDLGFEEEEGYLPWLATNRVKLANEIPIFFDLPYSTIERVASDADLLSRFIDLIQITVNEPVQDTQRFLDTLNNLSNTVCLYVRCNQPQDLFDRLPDQVQCLRIINTTVSDFRFLSRLKSLLRIHLYSSIDSSSIRLVLEEELPFLIFFEFKYLNKQVTINISVSTKQLTVSVEGEKKIVNDVNLAIQWIIEKAQLIQVFDLAIPL